MYKHACYKGHDPPEVAKGARAVVREPTLALLTAKLGVGDLAECLSVRISQRCEYH